jgi:hypothetical protein
MDISRRYGWNVRIQNDQKKLLIINVGDGVDNSRWNLVFDNYQEKRKRGVFQGNNGHFNNIGYNWIR